MRPLKIIYFGFIEKACFNHQAVQQPTSCIFLLAIKHHAIIPSEAVSDHDVELAPLI